MMQRFVYIVSTEARSSTGGCIECMELFYILCKNVCGNIHD